MLEIQFSNFFKQFIPEAVLINCKLSLYYIIEANNTDNYIAIHPGSHILHTLFTPKPQTGTFL